MPNAAELVAAPRGDEILGRVGGAAATCSAAAAVPQLPRLDWLISRGIRWCRQ